MHSDKQIKVSVRLMVYNHHEYIRQAIESILMQKTDFITEIVIGDDFSIDDSKAIVLSYNSTDKFIIRVLERCRGDEYDLTRKKLGRLYNFTDIITHCRGEYVAMLDGDDFWSDPNKLQEQVDLLDSNPDLILCHAWHFFGVRDESGQLSVRKAPVYNQGYYSVSISDVSRIFSNEMRCKSRTLMFRNILTTFPEWFYKIAYGDVALTMILGAYGKFGFINKPVAVYRQTETGVSRLGLTNRNFFLKHNLEYVRIWEYGDLFHSGRYKKLARETEIYFYKNILLHYRFSLIIWMKLSKFLLVQSKEKRIWRSYMIFYLFFYAFFKKFGSISKNR